MNFNSFRFLFFFTALYAVLWILKIPAIQRLFTRQRMRITHIILLLGSYLFLFMADSWICTLLLLLTVVIYSCALKMQEHPSHKIYLVLPVSLSLLLLGVFKYFNFFVTSFAEVFGISNVSTLRLILPIGISFYTFSAISYVVDVYRKKYPAAKDFIDVALFMSFFPKLTSGPIVRASDFLPQLQEDRGVSLKNLEIGIQIFVFGLFKKIVLADHLAIFVEDVFAVPVAFHSATLILAAVSYSLQIYLDFSGYSDMAVGLAKCLGYDLNRNFNLPYISRNVTEFWKRWHISLSSWLQDYLYIPLGGNRKGTVRTYLNLFLTMLLGGLWHGANWTFLAWGALHGLGLCVHKVFLKVRTGGTKQGSKFFTALSMAATFIFVSICWVFFRAPNFQTAFLVLKGAFVWQDGILQMYSWSFISIILTCIATIIAFRRSKSQAVYDKKTGRLQVNGYYFIMDLTKFWPLVILFTFIGIILGTAYVGGSPFIYGNF